MSQVKQTVMQAFGGRYAARANFEPRQGNLDQTICAWFRLTSDLTKTPLFSILSSYNNAQSLGIAGGQAFTSFVYPPPPRRRMLFSHVWYHFAFRILMTGECAIYVNGVLNTKSMSKLHPALSNNRALNLAMGPSTGSSAQLSEIQIWDRGLSDTEIRERMFHRATTNTPNLYACWPLTGNDRNRIPELTQRHQTYGTAGTQWVEVDDLPLVQPEQTQGLVCHYFDGRGARVEIPRKLQYDGSQPFTVQAWVRPEAKNVRAHEAPIIGCLSPNRGWELRCSGQEFAFIIADAQGVFQEIQFPNTAPNTWVHVAAIWEGNCAHLSINGFRVICIDMNGCRPHTGNLLIGHQPHWGGRNFQGRIAEVRFYTKARTEEEVQKDMFQRAFTVEGQPRVDTDHFISYWALDDTDPTVAKDTGGNHGRYIGAAPIDTAGWGLIGAEPPRQDYRVVLTQQVQQLEAQVGSLTQQLKAREAEKAALNAAYQKSSAWKPQVTQLTQLIKQLQQQITDRDTLIAQYQAKEQQKSVSVSLDEFIDTTNKQIREARARLAEDKRNLRLGRVSIDLRVVPDENGRSFRFPKLADEAGLTDLEPGKLSNLTVEFEDVEPPPARAPTRGVPDVGGYTEAMALRVLAEAGFSMTAHGQAVTDDNAAGQYGRVLTQHPPAGEQVPVNANVLVFIGKEA